MGLVMNGMEMTFSMLRTAAELVGIGMLGDLVGRLDMFWCHFEKKGEAPWFEGDRVGMRGMQCCHKKQVLLTANSGVFARTPLSNAENLD